MKVKWMLARQRKKGQSAELNQVLVQEGLCASLEQSDDCDRTIIQQEGV